jgi:hypothetical protein
MATIQKRKKKNGTYSYWVMIRQSDGFPPNYKTFPTREEAKDWAKQEEVRRRQGTYLSYKSIDRKTLEDLIDRYLTIVLPTKPPDFSHCAADVIKFSFKFYVNMHKMLACLCA